MTQPLRVLLIVLKVLYLSFLDYKRSTAKASEPVLAVI